MTDLEHDAPGLPGSPQLGEDHAPGDEPGESAGHWVRNYVLGLAFATGLTIASFWAATSHMIWAPAVPVAIVVFAIAQMGVHLVFFLHITTGPDNTNNVLALAFGLLVVFLIFAGSIWIMDHLTTNMMPAQQMRQMQP